MNKSILYSILFVTLVSCSTNKHKQVTKNDFQSYNEPCYVKCTFFPKNNHPMIMVGIGDNFDLNNFDLSNSDSFLESFYEQLSFSPIIVDNYIYKDIASCLGYEITWYKSHIDIFSKKISDYKITLHDKNILNIQIYKLSEEISVKYSNKKYECLNEMKTSIDFKEISEIKNIKKIAVIVDKGNVSD